MAIAVGLASVIVSIGLELVVPALIGHWLDTRFGTGPLLVVLGFFAGMILAGWHLMKLVAGLSAADSRRGKKQNP